LASRTEVAEQCQPPIVGTPVVITEVSFRRQFEQVVARREWMKASEPASGTHHRRSRAVGGDPHGLSAGSKILAAIVEATELLRAEGLESQRQTVRTYKVAPAPRVYRPGDVKRVRELLGVSQAVLAEFLGVNVNTVRSWEQGKRPPQPIACRFLSEIEADPGYWRQRIGQDVSETELGKAASDT
jgi:DNA-binding transcriptional regulator YiaG